ncbi:unnamed protein product, partial [Iphiclides podalirius]
MRDTSRRDPPGGLTFLFNRPASLSRAKTNKSMCASTSRSRGWTCTYETVPAGAEAGRGRRAGRTQRAERAAATAAAQRAALQRTCNNHGRHKRLTEATRAPKSLIREGLVLDYFGDAVITPMHDYVLGGNLL